MQIKVRFLHGCTFVISATKGGELYCITNMGEIKLNNPNLHCIILDGVAQRFQFWISLPIIRFRFYNLFFDQQQILPISDFSKKLGFFFDQKQFFRFAKNSPKNASISFRSQFPKKVAQKKWFRSGARFRIFLRSE